jgi:hypothetical protein
MSITPSTPAEKARGGFKTWVNSQRKFPASTGQFSVEININNDLPETRSILESQARAAGLDDAVELARYGWYRLFYFAFKQADLASS